MAEMEDFEKSFGKKMQELERFLAEFYKWKISIKQLRLHAQAYAQDLRVKENQAEAFILKIDNAVSALDTEVGVVEEMEFAPDQKQPNPPNKSGGEKNPARKRRGRAQKNTPPSVDDVLKKVETMGFEGIDRRYTKKMDKINNHFKGVKKP